MRHCPLLKLKRALFLWGKKNKSLSSDRVFLHFNDDPILYFIDFLHSIIFKSLLGDLFLTCSTWLKKEVECGIIISRWFSTTPLLVVTVSHLILEQWQFCGIFCWFPTGMFLSVRYSAVPVAQPGTIGTFCPLKSLQFLSRCSSRLDWRWAFSLIHFYHPWVLRV